MSSLDQRQVLEELADDSYLVLNNHHLFLFFNFIGVYIIFILLILLFIFFAPTFV